jgi:hypothetical protein
MSNGKLIKTKGDRTMLMVLIAFSLIIIIVIIASMSKTRNAPKEESSYTISSQDSADIKNTTTEFLDKAGNFGVNYDKLPTSSYKDMFDYYNVYMTSGAAMPSTLSPYVTTRKQAYDSLFSSTSGKASIAYPKSEFAGIDDAALKSNSDAASMSRFSVNANTVHIADPKKSVASINGENMPQVSILVSWDSTVTEVSATPGDIGEGTAPASPTNWNPKKESHSFTSISFTLVKSGKSSWQVYSVGPDSGVTNEFTSHEYMLAISDSNEY